MRFATNNDIWSGSHVFVKQRGSDVQRAAVIVDRDGPLVFFRFLEGVEGQGAVDQADADQVYHRNFYYEAKLFTVEESQQEVLALLLFLFINVQLCNARVVLKSLDSWNTCACT